jgi:hypothetical protein
MASQFRRLSSGSAALYSIFALCPFASLCSPLADFWHYLQMIYQTDSYEISARQTLLMKS